MKVFLFIVSSVFILSSKLFSQCPQAGLKIQSGACEEPKNLQADSVTCNGLKVYWTGIKGENYIVKAVSYDVATNNLIELETSQACDSNSNCAATVAAKAGRMVSWSIQTLCVIEGAVLYSREVQGKDVSMPTCERSVAKPNKLNTLNTLRIYPNPAPGYLVVEYTGNFSGSVIFKVYDITGKQIITTIKNVLPRMDRSYRLNLENLPPGTYTLEAENSGHVTKNQFVLLKKP